ncbi:dynein associated protein-domain-containing protein [Catenaria anguillulae PL171]|uniref:Dynein associated protein-domain-containing protein n=1 Tax=Catenaria anguillulae PL171 TaxID=765915 RepID=A0A1Y2HSB1_9FUNG|nr:dynein associated protein-domain-containing protein [Catenaria anguillulae PL171]
MAATGSKRVSLIAASQAAALASNRPPSRPTTPSSPSTLDRTLSTSSEFITGNGRTSPPAISEESAAALRNLVARGSGAADGTAKPASRRSSTMVATGGGTTPPSVPRSLSGSAENLPGSRGSVTPPSLPSSRRSSTMAPAASRPSAGLAPSTVTQLPNSQPVPTSVSMRPNEMPMPQPQSQAQQRPVPMPVQPIDVDDSMVVDDDDDHAGNDTDGSELARTANRKPSPMAGSPPLSAHSTLASPADAFPVDDEQGATRPPADISPATVLHHQASLASIRHQQQQQQQPTAAAVVTPVSPPVAAPLISAKDLDLLRVKVKHLESQRAQDLATIRALEATAASAKDALAGHEALQAKLKDEAKLAERDDEFEILTMEKLILEEKLEVVEVQMEEMKVEIEVMKEEQALGWGTGMAGAADRFADTGAGGADSDAPDLAAECRELRGQVARYKHALGVLKDEYDALETQVANEVTLKQMEAASGAEARAHLADLRARVAEVEANNAHLVEQLEDVREAPQMVEQLAGKISEMEDDMEETRKYVAELEALKEVADEMEQAHNEYERDLLANLQQRDAFIQGLELSLAKVENVMADYERTIALFREKVASMTRENEELRAVAHGAQGTAGSRALARGSANGIGDASIMSAGSSSGAGSGGEQQEVLALHHKLQTHAMKVQAKTIDLELKQLEAMQAGQHLSLVQAYLPQAFFATEQEPIAALLLVRRLMFKADMLLRHGGHTRPAPHHDGGASSSSSHVDELEAEVARMDLLHELGWMRRTAAALAAYMETCPADPELVSAEKRLDSAVAQVKTDGALRAQTVAPELARLNRHGVQAGAKSQVYRLAQLVQVYGAEDAAARAALAVQLVARAQLPGGPLDGVAEGMTMNLGNVKASARKLARTLEEAKGGLVADGQTVAEVLGSMQTVAKYFGDMAETLVVGDVMVVLEDLALRHFDRTESRPFMLVSDAVKRAAMDVAVLYETTSAQATAEPLDSSTANDPAPWLVLDPAAQQVLRSKDEEVRELTVRCQLLESRSFTSNAQSELTDLNQFVDHLRAEALELETRNRDLERKLNEAKLNTPSGGSVGGGGASGPVTPRMGSLSGSAVASTMASPARSRAVGGNGAGGASGSASSSSPELLVAAITHLRAENARLKAAKLMQQLDACPLPPLPLVSLHDLTIAPSAESSDDILDSLRLEARSLLRQARQLASSPRVVRVPDPAARRTQGWMPMEKRPGMQLQRDRIEARMLARKAIQLQASLAASTPGGMSMSAAGRQAFGARGPVRSSHSRRLSGSSVMSFMTNLTGVDKTPKVAMLRVPKVKGIGLVAETEAASVVNCYVNTPAELEQLHNVFVS